MLAFSPDGRTLAALSRHRPRDDLESAVPGCAAEDSIFLWGPRGGIAFRPDGRLIATTGTSGTLVLLDAATGAAAGSFGRYAPYPASGAVFSADGALVAFALAGGGISRAPGMGRRDALAA